MRGPELSRRQLLKAGAYGGLGAVLAGCSSTVKSATSTKPAGSDIGAIDHVVMLMQENRSFDHYFGTYPGARGFDDHQNGTLGVFAQAWPQNTSDSPAGKLLPFHLNTSTSDAECIHDLSHAWPVQHQCWNLGKMDSFVTTHTAPQNEGPNGTLTMGYYTRSDLSFYYALADAFTICDGYHCSVFGPTHPNRLMFWSGTLDPDGHDGGPVIVTNASSSFISSASWTTMPEALDAKGISWKVYNPPGAAYLPSSSSSLLISNNILLYFKQFTDPSSPLYHRAFSFTYPDDFARDVANGTLPQVSWVVAPTLPKDYSEHPPSPSAAGEWFSHQVLKSLTSNSKVWSKSALFISYDENDGFFDHVAPPTPPAGTPGEYLTVDPLPSSAGGIAGPLGLGFRVPLLVVSPFSAGGHVFSATSDHTSQLRFIETRFGARVPNLSSWRRSVTSDLTGSLSHSADTSVPALPATSQNDPRVARECKPPQLIEVEVASPPYPIPSPQRMPTQEAKRT